MLTYRFRDGVDDPGEADGIIKLLLFRAERQKYWKYYYSTHWIHSSQWGQEHEWNTHLLPLLLLLLPPLPLLFIYFADLDESLLLHTYISMNILFTVHTKKVKLVKIKCSHLFCFHSFHMKAFGKPVRTRQILIIFFIQHKNNNDSKNVDTYFQFSVWYMSFLWNLVTNIKCK